MNKKIDISIINLKNIKRHLEYYKNMIIDGENISEFISHNSYNYESKYKLENDTITFCISDNGILDNVTYCCKFNQIGFEENAKMFFNTTVSILKSIINRYEIRLTKLRDVGISMEILNDNDKYSVSFFDNPDVVKYTEVFDDNFKNIKPINSIVSVFLEETVKREINKLHKELHGCTIDGTTDRIISTNKYVINFDSREKFLEWLDSECVDNFLIDKS